LTKSVAYTEWTETSDTNIVIYRDAKSPVSGGKLPYFDVHYGLPYGRTCLPFSPFTYGASGGDHHTHAGEAAVLLLDRQMHHSLIIYAVLAQTRDAQDVARLKTWRIGVIKVKKRNICKSTKINAVIK